MKTGFVVFVYGTCFREVKRPTSCECWNDQKSILKGETRLECPRRGTELFRSESLGAGKGDYVRLGAPDSTFQYTPLCGYMTLCSVIVRIFSYIRFYYIAIAALHYCMLHGFSGTRFRVLLCALHSTPTSLLSSQLLQHWSHITWTAFARRLAPFTVRQS